MNTDSKHKARVNEEWLYRRLQATGRAQARYLLLFLLTVVYSVGVYLSPSGVLTVPILGLRDLDSQVVHTAIAFVLSTLIIAFNGTRQAAGRAYDTLASVLSTETEELKAFEIDEYPNVLDFLGDAGRKKRRSGVGYGRWPISFTLHRWPSSRSSGLVSYTCR
jgi:hypothetical protein